MNHKSTTAFILSAMIGLPGLAAGSPCPNPSTNEHHDAELRGNVVQADDFLTSFDQARLVGSLKQTSRDPIEAIRAQVLADRDATSAQFASLKQPRMIGADTHYSISNLVEFTQPHYGQTHQFRVTGSDHGDVWGTDVYVAASHLGTAAVHAGLLKVGETGVVTVRIVEPLAKYSGTERRGVRTHENNHYDAAYEFLADASTNTLSASFDQAELMTALFDGIRLVGESDHYMLHNVISLDAEHHGETHRFRVVGTKFGLVYGSGVYSSRSHLGAAAVHAGVLKEHESGIVTIRVYSPPSVSGETRNGIRSGGIAHGWGMFEFVPEPNSDSSSPPLLTSTEPSHVDQMPPLVVIDPVEQIRQQVLDNRDSVADQIEAIKAAQANRASVSTQALNAKDR